MHHLRARRLLAGLPDGTLPPEVAERVQAHVARCRACRRILAQYEALDRVLRELPQPLCPAEPDPDSERALGLLARWGRLDAPWYERVPVHPLGAILTAALLLLAAFVAIPPFEIESAEPFNAVVLAEAPPARTTVRAVGRAGPDRAAAPAHQSANETWLIPVAMK